MKESGAWKLSSACLESGRPAWILRSRKKARAQANARNKASALGVEGFNSLMTKRRPPIRNRTIQRVTATRVFMTFRKLRFRLDQTMNKGRGLICLQKFSVFSRRLLRFNGFKSVPCATLWPRISICSICGICGIKNRLAGLKARYTVPMSNSTVLDRLLDPVALLLTPEVAERIVRFRADAATQARVSEHNDRRPAAGLRLGASRSQV